MVYVIASRKLGSRLGGLMAKEYSSRGRAQAALDKMRKSWHPLPSNGWEVTDMDTYRTQFVRKVFVKSLMNPNGPDVEITSDTPACCDPSTETYWSM